MTHTHTHGPWELEHCRNKDGSKFITINGQGPHGAWLADIQAGDVNGKPADVTEKHLANARLIAAAPDLLAALRGLMTQAVKDAESYAEDDSEAIWAWIKDAADAIAKATGKGDA
jgi:hypothetical protein